MISNEDMAYTIIIINNGCTIVMINSINIENIDIPNP
ncbi:MAG: hypothetical protein ACI9IP_001298 [Arcticibacterium sp.]|jgi:hypothetical protein